MSVALSVVVLHVVLAPLLLPGRAIGARSTRRSLALADDSVPATPDVVDKTVILINPPSDAHAGYLSFRRAADGVPRPRTLRWLATGITEVTLVREDANTLRVDTDAGTQTRVLRFNARASAGAKPTWQGESVARWERVAEPEIGGSLRVVTSNMRAGYLRKNGVPYSERATVSENFDLAPLANGGQLLLVTTVVEDPVYLNGPYVTSPHFKKEPDGSKWDPTPCSSTW